jgi:clan AA aspartic protease
MTGQVEALHALIEVPFLLAGRQRVVVTFVVDTGFAGHLALRSEAIAALGLSFVRTIAATLADDSSIDVDAYSADVLWDGEPRPVTVIATGMRPLLGASMLAGYRLEVEFEDGGFVGAKPL